MLSTARAKIALNGMTASAKKVFNAVPITDDWTGQQIHAELKRMGQHLEQGIVFGCINGLIDAGLVSEPRKGEFRRAPVREVNKPQVQEIDMSKQENVVIKEIPVVAPIDRLGQLAARAIAMAVDMKALASEIEAAALEAQAEIEAKDAGLANARKLQELLKSMTL